MSVPLWAGSLTLAPSQHTQDTAGHWISLMEIGLMECCSNECVHHQLIPSPASDESALREAIGYGPLLLLTEQCSPVVCQWLCSDGRGAGVCVQSHGALDSIAPSQFSCFRVVKLLGHASVPVSRPCLHSLFEFSIGTHCCARLSLCD